MNSACVHPVRLPLKTVLQKVLNVLLSGEHLWGIIPWKDLTAYSRYYVLFKDMTISLVYLNLDGTIVSNGFLSRRTGNIPICRYRS